jgi:hypothetical protein
MEKEVIELSRFVTVLEFDVERRFAPSGFAVIFSRAIQGIVGGR